MQEATKLRHRPFLHCSTIPLVIFALSWLLQNVISHRHTVWITIILCAFISHHIRDSTRRGLWLWPFGHTKPLPYLAYIGITQALPHILAYFIKTSRTTYDKVVMDV